MPDFWYFIMLWSTLFCTVGYFLLSLWAYFVFKRYPLALIIPPIFTVVGALTGFVGGSLIGLVLAVLYQAASFKMSTYIALLWGLLYTILLLLSSNSTITTLL